MANPPTTTPTATATTTTTTRATYAHNLLTHPLPSRPSPVYANLHHALETLLSALTTHPAMTPNLAQPCDNPTPAARTKVYFMWDFIARTLEHLHEVQNTRPDGGQAGEGEREKWEDVIGRVAYARGLILDDIRAERNGGDGGGSVLERMMGVGASAATGEGERIVFGKAVERAAREL